MKIEKFLKMNKVADDIQANIGDNFYITVRFGGLHDDSLILQIDEKQEK